MPTTIEAGSPPSQTREGTMEETIAPPEEKSTNVDFIELAQLLAQTAADMQATDIVILDLRGRVYYTDAFVLCTARNRRQAIAIAEEVRAVVKNKFGTYPLRVEGKQAGQWILVEFEDVVVHIFDQARRGFYDLDGLWADAPRIEGPASDEPSEPRFFQ